MKLLFKDLKTNNNMVIKCKRWWPYKDGIVYIDFNNNHIIFDYAKHTNLILFSVLV